MRLLLKINCNSQSVRRWWLKILTQFQNHRVRPATVSPMHSSKIQCLSQAWTLLVSEYSPMWHDVCTKDQSYQYDTRLAFCGEKLSGLPLFLKTTVLFIIINYCCTILSVVQCDVVLELGLNVLMLHTSCQFPLSVLRITISPPN